MKNELANPADPSGLVDYQPGSVVSRVVFRGDGGTMTAFAFAEGEGLTEHSNPNDAVVAVLEGSVRITIAGDEHLVGVGECLHLPPGVPHSLIGGAPFKMLLTILKK